MTTQWDNVQSSGIISSGSPDIDRFLGGGIPYQTLMLLEGASASGKSTLAQQFVWGALTTGESATLYITEQTLQNCLRQMSSLGQDVRDYFLLHHLEIFPIAAISNGVELSQVFEDLANHLESQQDRRVIVVDSLSTFVETNVIGHLHSFLARCKILCDAGKVIICTIHSDVFDKSSMAQVRAVCDAHLRLEVTKSRGQLLKKLEVSKIRGAELPTGNILEFQIHPGLGIKIVSRSQARA